MGPCTHGGDLSSWLHPAQPQPLWVFGEGTRRSETVCVRVSNFLKRGNMLQKRGELGAGWPLTPGDSLQAQVALGCHSIS